MRAARRLIRGAYLGYEPIHRRGKESLTRTPCELRLEEDAYAAHRRHFARVRHAAPLNQLLYVDLKTFLPNLNLAYTDKTSMAANLEVRVPFLNREMIEMTARMPPDLKLRGFKRKYILKRSMEKLLPHDVIGVRGRLRRAHSLVAARALVRRWDLLSEDTVRRRGF